MNTKLKDGADDIEDILDDPFAASPKQSGPLEAKAQQAASHPDCSIEKR